MEEFNKMERIMKKITYLLMSLSLVTFVSCSDDKENEQSGSGNVPENSSWILSSSGKERGHSYVDLGLPSGTKWAAWNVGAAVPQDYGYYYAWGETTTKEVYNWETYRFTTDGGSTITKYNSTDSKATLEFSDDAAHVNWGGKWRMPIFEQWSELSHECYWVWTDNYNNSNVKGYIVYKAKTSSDKGKCIYEGKTPSSSYKLYDAHIFLPAGGCRCDGDFYGIGYGAVGYYWSSSTFIDASYGAWGFLLYSDFNGFSYGNYDESRNIGYTIRPVLNQKY